MLFADAPRGVVYRVGLDLAWWRVLPLSFFPKTTTNFFLAFPLLAYGHHSAPETTWFIPAASTASNVFFVLLAPV